MIKKILPLLFAITFMGCNSGTKVENEEYTAISPEFSADSAFAYIEAQCQFGPRTMNSAAHDSCGNWIANKFESFGAKVYNQYADSKLYDGTPIKMRNIIASTNPDAPTRIIICSHWDSRPWADHDADERNHRTPIDGANDGASGVGVMLEMARLLQVDAQKGDSAFFALHPSIGIDFICWDAEDCGTPEFDRTDEPSDKTWCLGSQYWAGVRHIEGYSARYGILLDMVGGVNTFFNKEGYSLHYAPDIVSRVWAMGAQLGFSKYFVNTPASEVGYVTDDHVQVMQGGIPCIDIIGNNVDGGSFPASWHTVSDNINSIDRQVLKAVGQTLTEVIWNEN